MIGEAAAFAKGAALAKGALDVGKIVEVGSTVLTVAREIGAFDKIRNDVNAPIRHISTINERLEGKKYPGTNVEYGRTTFRLNGERVEGVFPRFNSKFDTVLPNNLRDASDAEQFKYCTKKLAARIENDPSFAKNFTSRQIQQIKAGEPRISGLTWHHNERPGRMQLVDSNLHATCKHTGGKSIWGGGSSHR